MLCLARSGGLEGHRVRARARPQGPQKSDPTPWPGPKLPFFKARTLAATRANFLALRAHERACRPRQLKPFGLSAVLLAACRSSRPWKAISRPEGWPWSAVWASAGGRPRARPGAAPARRRPAPWMSCWLFSFARFAASRTGAVAMVRTVFSPVGGPWWRPSCRSSCACAGGQAAPKYEDPGELPPARRSPRKDRTAEAGGVEEARP